MSAIAIIQARMSSTRLPGKVLLPLADKPMIWHIVERAKACKLVDLVIVATSVEASDDPLASFCADSGILCFRGSLDDVLSRFIEILKIHPADFVVRITGDCPLIDPVFIDRQIRALQLHEGDKTWSANHVAVLEGQGVLSSRSLSYIYKHSEDPDDKEHVGSRFMVENANLFKLIEMEPPEALVRLPYRLCVDEAADYEMMCRVYDELWRDGEIIPFEKVIDWLGANPDATGHNQCVVHSAINRELFAKIGSSRSGIVGAVDWDIVTYDTSNE